MTARVKARSVAVAIGAGLGLGLGLGWVWCFLHRRRLAQQLKPADNKMVANDTTSPETAARFEAARARLRKAGYSVADGTLFQEIHCNTQPGCEQLAWIENGFVQCFVDVDGRSARVMDYAPGQLLQPHRHDIDELFEIRGGGVRVTKWPNGTKDQRQSVSLKTGDKIEIPAGMPHALTCHPEDGLQFHELVGTGTEAFAKRQTVFLVNAGFSMDKTPPSFAG